MQATKLSFSQSAHSDTSESVRPSDISSSLSFSVYFTSRDLVRDERLVGALHNKYMHGHNSTVSGCRVKGRGKTPTVCCPLSGAWVADHWAGSSSFVTFFRHWKRSQLQQWSVQHPWKTSFVSAANESNTAVSNPSEHIKGEAASYRGC